jgi:hypothetical protein
MGFRRSGSIGAVVVTPTHVLKHGWPAFRIGESAGINAAPTLK